MLDTLMAPFGAWRGVARRGGVVLALVTVTLLLAACNRVDTGSGLTFWDIFWSIVVFFVWVLYIFIFISIFIDIFRRDDLSGGWKVIWILFLFIIPFISALVYIIARPKITPSDIRMATQAEAAGKVSTADELTKLQQLKDSGAISQAEYDKLKGQIVS